MIIDTYSPYHRPPPVNHPTQDHGNAQSGEQQATQNKQRIFRNYELNYDLETTQQLDDLILRLNSKSPLFQSPIRFEMQTVNRRPMILMLDQGEVLRYFEPEQALDLERSLFDMAGFRISFET